jgi:hypothetical protein
MDLYVKEILVTKFRMRCQYLSGLNSVYYFKSCIFVESDVLWITGKNELFN